MGLDGRLGFGDDGWLQRGGDSSRDSYRGRGRIEGSPLRGIFGGTLFGSRGTADVAEVKDVDELALFGLFFLLHS